MPTDIEIARAATLRPITEIAHKLDIPDDAVECYGRYKAKVDPQQIEASQKRGKLILVTAISPTPAGEGKTTTSVGLADGLQKIGKRAVVCLREPSLGPCFGMKGGAAGGGYAQVVPMEDINLHFTGDFHAITAAHNLLAALLDNHIHHGNALGLDVRKISWRRVLDVNDRALRNVVIGLGGVGNSIPRETHFDITVASEVMAILCLSRSLAELKSRLAQIIVGETSPGRAITAADLKADGAMAALLRDAVRPNLVQTLEGTPAFVHGGPFANIAHGCSSVAATSLSLSLADYTVTEAGFGADLGAEKFFDIKCRKAGLVPDVAVIVATVRALKHHGGVAVSELSSENVGAVERGLCNLTQHIENVASFGVPVAVAINRFPTDTETELATIVSCCEKLGVPAVVAEHWAHGGAGAESLARAVVNLTANLADASAPRKTFRLLYDDALPLWDKIEKIAKEIYRADGIVADEKVKRQLDALTKSGFGEFPICMAKTQYSFSADPSRKGAPRGFTIPIREVRVSAGAGFVVVVTGDIMTMPGLPKVPAAESIGVNDAGEIAGLF
ncbi:MAG: formate--tetrahydrofolate ligase [Thermoguttaceae bacterium]